MFGQAPARDLPGPDWLRRRRADAAERAESAGLPSTDEEVWRYSRIAELEVERYEPVTSAPPGDVPSGATRLLDLVPERAGEVVLRDGFVVHRSLRDEWSERGVRIETLADAADGEQLLDAVVEAPADVFSQSNLAYGPDPIVIDVPDRVTLDAPIVIVDWVSADGAAVFTRVVTRLGAASEATIVEWQGGDDVDALVVPITDLDVGADARLAYLTVQTRGPRTWQIAEQATRVGQQATFDGHQVGLGGDYARSRVDCRLVGRGATGNIRAAYFGQHEQMLDYRTFQDHSAPDTTSDLLFKGAVGGTSRSVYTGLIHVAKEARGTNAFQTNRNIKLSDGAWAESVPNLEIENNDVRCSHASTVGPIDEEQRFYLESRAVPPAVAERLIVNGFFHEVLDQLPVPELVPGLLAEVDHRLAPGIE
jgi:Fe-S cluster assembly protein SufD